jgi:RHS repeat-associated protein
MARDQPAFSLILLSGKFSWNSRSQSAAYLSSLTVNFVHADWLNTERRRFNVAVQACETFTSEPFGEDVVTSTPSGVTGCNPTPDFFTGKPRDKESNLDGFGARYFSSQWGRWMSPDWSASPTEVPYSTLANPQSLNLYAYVGNDPIVGEDADGHFTVPFGDGTNDGDNNDAGQRATAAGKDQSTTPASEKPAAQQQQGSQAEPQTSTADSDKVTYKPGVPKASPAVSDMLICTANCSDEKLRVTSTNEAIPQHPDGTPHRKGEPADITVEPGTEKKVLKCAASCGAKFAQDEGAHPIPGHTTGPHIHLQTVPGRLGGRGDLPKDQINPSTP